MDLGNVLVIGFILYAVLSQLTRARRQEEAPSEPTEPPAEAPDWGDLGDLLEGLGFPRPSGTSRTPQEPPGEQDAYAEEAAVPATTEPRKVAEARPHDGVPRPPERIGQGRAVIDVSAPAETAPAALGASDADGRSKGASRGGLLIPRLERYSEMERAVLYAEILSAPKALRD